MRISERYMKDLMLMFSVNYVICIILSAVFFRGNIGTLYHSKGVPFALFLGSISGIMYLVSFLTFQFNIHENGVILAATFMKLGVIVPTMMAMVAFGELPDLIQMIGLILACVAIVISQLQGDDESKSNHKGIWLLVLLLVAGFTDSLANIYDKMGNGDIKDYYLFFTFSVAALCSIGAWIYRGAHISKEDILFGFLLGIPNYFSARFLILSLGQLPAILVYPVYSTLTIVVASIAGLVFFKEQIRKQKAIAIVIIPIAIALLS